MQTLNLNLVKFSKLNHVQVYLNINLCKCIDFTGALISKGVNEGLKLLNCYNYL